MAVTPNTTTLTYTRTEMLAAALEAYANVCSHVEAEVRRRAALSAPVKHVACQTCAERNKLALMLMYALGDSDQSTAVVQTPLPRRQLAVLSYLCRRWTVKKIGEEMGISENTVRNHMKAIFVTVGATSQLELARELASFLGAF